MKLIHRLEWCAVLVVMIGCGSAQSQLNSSRIHYDWPLVEVRTAVLDVLKESGYQVTEDMCEARMFSIVAECQNVTNHLVQWVDGWGDAGQCEIQFATGIVDEIREMDLSLSGKRLIRVRDNLDEARAARLEASQWRIQTLMERRLENAQR